MKIRKYIRMLSLLVVCTMVLSMLSSTSMAYENQSESIVVQEFEEYLAQSVENLLSEQSNKLTTSFIESNYTCYVGSVITLSLEDNGFLSASWSCNDADAVVFLEDRAVNTASKQVRAVKEGTYTITADICTFTNDYSVSTILTILPVPEISNNSYSYQVGDEGVVSFTYSYTKPIESVEWVLSDEAAFSFVGDTSILSTVTPDTDNGIYEYVVSIPVVCLKEGSFQISASIDMGDQLISVVIPVGVTQQLFSGELEYIGDLLADTANYATIDGVDYEINENCNISEVNQAYYGDRCSTVVYSLDDEGKIEQIYPADIIFEPTISMSSDTDSFGYKNELWNSLQMNVTVKLSWKVLASSPFTRESLSSSSISIKIHELMLSTESDALNFGTTGGLFSKEIKETYKNGFQLTYGQTKKLTFAISVSDDYVPNEVTEYAEVQASVTTAWNNEAVACRPVAVSMGNLDLQAEKAAEAKKIRTETQAKKAVSSQLDLMKEKSVISYSHNLASWFTDEEYEKIEEFLLMYLGFLLASQEDTFLDSIDETCKNAVQERIESLLGVDDVYGDYLLGLGGNSIKSTVQYRTINKEGDWTTVTFNFAVDSYTKSGAVSYGSLAKINYSIEGDNQSSSNANFLYVTYVDFDAFSDVVLDYVNLAANEIYSDLLGIRVDIGESIDKLASELVPEVFDKILGGSYSDRVYNAYVGWLKNSTKKYSFHCPVDVYVYDRSGNLAASVVNNEINTACTDILAAVNGDSKIIYLTGDSYRMELIGSDEGSMDYTIEEFDNGALSRTVQINDVPLESGIVYDALAPEYPGIPAEAYSLCSDAGNIIYADEDSLGISIKSNISLKKTGNCGANATYRLFSNGMLVISGTGSMSDYNSNSWYSSTNPPYSDSTIKYVVVDQGITRVGDFAFGGDGSYNEVYWNDSILEIVVADSVTEIGEYAFYRATNLRDIYIGSSVESIGDWSFSYCYGLRGIHVDDANENFVSDNGVLFSKDMTQLVCYPRVSKDSYIIPDGVTTIGKDAFGSNYYLKNVVIPESVTSIGKSAFDDCTALETVTIECSFVPNGVFTNCPKLSTLIISENLSEWSRIDIETLTRIQISEQNPYFASDDQGAVYDKEYATLLMCPRGFSGDFVIPEGVTAISDFAFYGCSGLTSVTIPDGMVDIGYHAFSGCIGLTEINIPEGVANIEAYAFYNCSSLSEISIPGSINEIEYDTFASCSSLVEVTLPVGITKIGHSAFSDCENLTTIEIPASVTSIGISVFYNCKSLTAINVAAGNTKFHSIDGVLYNNVCTSVLLCPAGKTGVFVIPSSVTDIGDDAFSYCTGLSEIILPDNLKHIGDDAFSYCTGLSEIILPDNLKHIGDGAFNYCSNLCKIVIPSSVTDIGGYAFAFCTSLSEITLSDNLKYIGYAAFMRCSDLSKIVIPSSVTDIGDSAFWRCTGLSEIIFVGNCPDAISTSSFYGVAANVYYNENNSSWTSDTMLNYGGTLTWIAKDLCSEGYHNYEHIVTVPTCTEQGYTTYICSACGDTYVDTYVEDLGHDMGEWFPVTEPTCTVDGLEQRDCSRCDYHETQVIEATGHDYESLVTDPTCIAQGYTTHTCTNCGDSYTDSHTAALGHSFTEYVSDGNATCTQDGTKTAVCDRCDATDTVIEEGSAQGHDFAEWTVVQKPTETVEGLESRYCLNCGVEETRAVACLVNPFGDVPGGSFYYEPVMWAVEKGITNGTSATTFCPDDQCMRAHVVTFLWRAVGSPEPTRTDNPFVDVKPTDFYYKPVLWALENGITSGMDATHFGPTSYCNRAQVVTFLYRTMGSPALESTDNPFDDVQAGSFYEKPVLWAVENGITNGLSATTFGPNTVCNRAQIVTFMYRAFVD